MNTSVVTFLVGLFSVCQCNSPVYIKKAPYVVSLIDNKLNIQCMGVLLSRKHVLTTPDCAKDVVEVKIGAMSPYFCGEEGNVDEIQINNTTELAVIVMKKRISVTSRIRPVELIPDFDNISQNVSKDLFNFNVDTSLLEGYAVTIDPATNTIKIQEGDDIPVTKGAPIVFNNQLAALYVKDTEDKKKQIIYLKDHVNWIGQYSGGASLTISALLIVVISLIQMF